MATRRWSITPQGQMTDVVEAVGAATVTAAIEVTVDIDALKALNGVNRNLVIDGLEKIQEYINRGLWPPA